MRQLTLTIVAAILPALLCLPSYGDGDPAPSAEEPPAFWEVSISRKVDWPPLAKPVKRKKKREEEEEAVKEVATGKEREESEEELAEPEVITERIVQATVVGTLLGVSSETVVLKPVFGSEELVSISIDRVSSIRKARPNQPKNEPAKEEDEKLGKPEKKKNPAAKPEPDDGMRNVSFWRGSSLPARLLRVSPGAIVFSFGDDKAGELAVPFEEIRSITPLSIDPKSARKLESLPSPTGRHVARLKTGEVITGNIAPVEGESDRLKINSPILSGDFPLALVESIFFPNPEVVSGSITEPSGQIRRVVRVTFSGGSSLTSDTITLHNGVLELELWKGSPLRVPLESAENISFVEVGGIRPTGPILLWGAHSDLSDEFAKSQTTLEQAVVGRELEVLDGSEHGAEFERALRRSSTLVWAEWENFDGGTFDDQLAGQGMRALDEQLQEFVRSGGIIVMLGISNGNAGEFQRLGLGEITCKNSFSDGSVLELTGPGEAFTTVVEGDVQATNSTLMYLATEENGWTPFLSNPGSPEEAAVIGRNIGSGWVFLMGMDFYETNENVTRILLELTSYHR
jgi:hypothetical protein